MIWNMVKTWIFHGLVTAAFGLLGLIAGGSAWAIACAVGFYFGREIRQFEGHTVKEETILGWIDHIGDTLLPVAVALGFAIWM